MTSRCRDNNLVLYISKTKELNVGYRRAAVAEVDRVSCFRFLGINISEGVMPY